MLGGSVREAVRLPSALWALISVLTFVPLVAGDVAADLESALADKANMTIYRGLVKVRRFSRSCGVLHDS